MNHGKGPTGMLSSARGHGDMLVASLHGEVDLNNSPELRTRLMGLLAEHRPARLVLNLADVPYMDSSAVAVLVEMMRKLGKSKVILTDLQPRVRGLLEIARLESVFGVVATEREALGS